MSEPVWQVQIIGRALDLQRLAREFVSAPTRIARDDRDDCYVLEDSAFQSQSSSELVLAQAADRLSILAGVLKFEYQSAETLRAGAAIRKHADGRRDAFVQVNETISVNAWFEAGDANSGGNSSSVHGVTPQSPRSVRLAALATSDPSLAKALRLHSNDAHSWVGLYRLYEVIVS